MLVPGLLKDSLGLLRERRFGTFWFASLLSNIGTWAQQVAQPWLLLSLGASPFLLGLDSFAMDAPVWILTLVGGTLADRAHRRRVISVCQTIQMMCPALLVALLLGTTQPWIVVLLSLVVGVTDALSMPSFQSIVPSSNTSANTLIQKAATPRYRGQTVSLMMLAMRGYSSLAASPPGSRSVLSAFDGLSRARAARLP